MYTTLFEVVARTRNYTVATQFQVIGKNNNNVSDKEGEDEEDDEGTSKGKVYITPKGQGQGTHPRHPSNQR
jgi:hypothetical protein